MIILIINVNKILIKKIKKSLEHNISVVNDGEEYFQKKIHPKISMNKKKRIKFSMKLFSLLSNSNVIN